MFDFAHTLAKEIMVPRVDMVYLSTTWPSGATSKWRLRTASRATRCAEGDRDHIIGMVHIKDLLAIAGDPNADIQLHHGAK